MPLLTLPEELLAQVMMRVADIRYINRATRVCRQLRVATEAACELRIREDGGPLYVPAVSYFSMLASHRITPFTWRTRLFFSFSEAYEQAFKLYVLNTGLLIYGSPCYQDPSALRESKCIAHVLNGLDDDVSMTQTRLDAVQKKMMQVFKKAKSNHQVRAHIHSNYGHTHILSMLSDTVDEPREEETIDRLITHMPCVHPRADEPSAVPVAARPAHFRRAPRLTHSCARTHQLCMIIFLTILLIVLVSLVFS